MHSLEDELRVLEVSEFLEKVTLGVTQVVALSHIPLVCGPHLGIVSAFHRDQSFVLRVNQVREVDLGLLVVLEGVEPSEDSVESPSLVEEALNVLGSDQGQLMVEAFLD